MRWGALIGLFATTSCSLILAGDLDDARDPVIEIGKKDGGGDAGVTVIDSGVASDVVAEAAATGFEAEIRADSPLAWWRFEGSLHDEVGDHDLVATDPDSLKFDSSGVAGSRAAHFVSGGRLASPELLATGSNEDFAVEAWVKRGFSDTHYGTVFEKNTYEAQRNGMVFWVNPGRDIGSAFEVWNGTTLTEAAVGSPIPTDKLVHIAVTRTSGTCRVYIDGVARSTTSDHADISDATKEMGFGNGFVGVLDEIAVYTHSLSAVRVAAHAEAGR